MSAQHCGGRPQAEADAPVPVSGAERESPAGRPGARPNQGRVFAVLVALGMIGRNLFGDSR